MAADWGNALTGGITGAGIGSAGGPWGAAAGAAIGGTMGLFGGGKSKGDKIKQLANYSPEQQQLINEAVQAARQGNQNAMKWLNSILSDEEGAFEDFERPFKEEFEQQTVPSILERLQGTGMSKGGSALNQTLAQAGRGLSGDLATLRSKLKMGAGEQLLNYNNIALKQLNTPYIKSGKTGAFEMAAPAAAQGYSNLLSNYSQGSQQQQAKPWDIPTPAVGMAGPATAGRR